MNAPHERLPVQAAAHPAARRADWLRILTQWHWISSAVSLVGILFFAVTGITLNHADLFERTSAEVSVREAVLPAALRAELAPPTEGATDELPASLRAWLRDNWQLALYPKGIEWNADEIFVDLKRPGVDAALSIDRHSGAIRYETADRGWVAYLNELHRGRNAGPVWHAFITLFGVACVVFSLSGLLILQLHARARWTVWPLCGLGLVLPAVLMLLFVH